MEPAPIDDVDAAAAVVDQSGLLQGASDHRDRGAPNAEHLGQKLLRERKVIALDAITRHQKPPRAPLLHGVGPIACRMLCDLDHHRLGVAQQQSVQARGAPNLLQDGSGGNLQRAAGDLTQPLHGSRGDAEDHGNADDALVADRHHLHIVGVRHLDDEGNHATDGKVHVADLTAGCIQHLVSIDRFGFGATEEAVALLRIKDGEKTIG